MIAEGKDDRGAPAHLDALTGLRGIAAWAVVLYHIRASLTVILPGAVIDVLAKGYLAVDLFFILSGFVLWYNYAPRLRERGLAEAGPFLWRRIARIWPLHAVILGVFVALALLLLATGRDTSDYPFAELPLHLLLMQNWGLTAELSWNHPAWSISCEWAAYLLFPIAAIALHWEKWRSGALLIVLCGLLASMYGLSLVFGLTSLGADIPHFGVPRCIIEFGAGTILSALWLRWRSGSRLPALISALIALGGLGLYLAIDAEPLSIFLGFAALTLFLALSSGWARNPLNGRLLHMLGTISYATYLVHTILFKMFKLLFVRNPDDVPLSSLAAYLVLTLIMSAILYNLVERPAQRWMNRAA